MQPYAVLEERIYGPTSVGSNVPVLLPVTTAGGDGGKHLMKKPSKETEDQGMYRGKTSRDLKNLELKRYFSGNLRPFMVKSIHMEPKKKLSEPLQWK